MFCIAMTGASGTGKTSLATALSRNMNLPICRVGSRTVAREMGFTDPYEPDKVGRRLEFQLELLRQKLEWEQERKESGFITDRTHVDNLAYTLLHMQGHMTKGGTEASRKLLNTYRQAQTAYTHVFHCPMSSHIEHDNDPDRKEDEVYHMAFEVLLEGLFARMQVPGQHHFSFGVSTLEQRVSTVENCLKRTTIGR